MPMYMDIHDAPGATAQAVAAAHMADLEIQAKYGVEYHKYWFNEEKGTIFCLCSAPSAEAAVTVHREAHGLLPKNVIEVAPEVADGFLGGCEMNSDGAALLPGNFSNERDPGIRTVLFTDMVGSTSAAQRLGDDAAIAMVNIHDGIVRNALAACGGREIKHTGDGIMSCFSSAAAAVRCARMIQSAFAEHPERHGDAPVTVRIGAAAGEPVENNRDLFGATVQLAARLCSHAEPEQTLVSNVVAELCIGKGIAFNDLGEVLLKGFERPTHICAVS